ncbi:MAG: DNA polymerase III subunit alpha [Bacteroidaceae bacterium]|nr:DNA polymerase III subunit alpha [Bacteroidaceae bacterium]
MQNFIHLHVHTQYSLLDGQASIPKLVEKAIADGMPGMAITDHGNMMGVKEYFNYVNKRNKKLKEEGREPFKPIFGCEMYVANRTLYDKDKDRGDNARYHLIVLAKNQTGYHNLVKLVSKSWVDGFYTRPRTDHNELQRHAEGLIVCSACIAGEVPRFILQGNIAKAEERIKWYKSVFGDDYYLEIQRHEVRDPNQRANRETFPLQQRANAVILELAKKYDVKVVCTNDVHFVDEDNAEAHDRLICLGTNRDLDDPKRMLYSKQEWFKTTAEMNAIFADVPEALANTMEVFDKVEAYSIDHAPIMPNFPIPKSFATEDDYRQRFTDQELIDEFTHDENGNEVCTQEEAEKKVKALGGVEKLYRLKLEADYLAHLTFAGARRIYGDPLSQEVEDRIRFELHVMKTMGFPGYFLIVQDYINAARYELGVSVGPGRGSAAGSVVAYCLGITKVDPIKYDLLFERFLNPDRISLPDIDVDFDDDGRGKVLSWVTQKYGEANVAHIITYGTMATKLAIKDVARVQKLPLDISNALCKAIPDKLPDDEKGNARKMNLTNAIACVPELQQAAVSPNEVLRDTITYARMLEGNVRNTGVHACGVIICRDDVSDWVPVSTAEDKETGEKMICTQYEGSVIEDTGLIKMDFLGLKTLSIINEAISNIHDSLGIDIDIDRIDIDDPATYQLYCNGQTTGTFQFESAGMQKYLRELQPSTFEDLIAMNALYRPGPMKYIPDFIDRKQGRKPVEYDIPCMEKYLKDTYGITVYQEQVMLLSRQLANFTRGESDTLRKAMGKKLKDKLDHMKPKFIKQGQENGHNPATLEKIWGDWEDFASYAFNKSHATCYSWVAYQTAWLKANFPAEYMAADLSRNLDNITEITKLMGECKTLGLQVLGPDINKSRHKFSVDADGNIRFGLGAIKGLGESAVDAIINEREAGGPFLGIFDFVQRVSIPAVKRSGLESLVLSGALDSFKDLCREQYFARNSKGDHFIDTLVRFGQLYQEAKQSAEASLFGDFGAVEVSTPPIPQDYEQWSQLERLNRERDLVGIYLSAHPLDDFAVVLNDVCTTRVTELAEKERWVNQDITFGGIVTAVRQGVGKSGQPYGIVTLEDFSGAGELPLWGNDWSTWANYMNVGTSIFVNAKVTPGKYNPNRIEIVIGRIQYLDAVKNDLIKNITITIPLAKVTEDFVQAVHDLTDDSPGNADLYFQILDPEGHMPIKLHSRTHKITVQRQLIEYIMSNDDLTYKINAE